MQKQIKAIFVTLVVVFTFPVLAQDALQNQRIDELFRRYDGLASQQDQLNQKVNSLEQTVESFDNSVDQLSRTVAALAAILSNQNQQVSQQGRALSTEALSSFSNTNPATNTAANVANAVTTSSFATTSSIFPNPAIPSAGIDGNAFATPGVLIQPQPVAGAVVSPPPSVVTTVTPTQNGQSGASGASDFGTPVMVYGARPVNGSVATTNSNSGNFPAVVLQPAPVTMVSPTSSPSVSGTTSFQSGITHVYQATPAYGIQNINGSSATLPTGSFSPNAFPNTQSQLPAARYLQVGAYTDYTLAGRHASLLRGLSYPVSERQEGIWIKLLIGPLPMEQINMIKGRLDSQGINSFVTQ